jgi:hypothetical protein
MILNSGKLGARKIPMILEKQPSENSCGHQLQIQPKGNGCRIGDLET